MRRYADISLGPNRSAPLFEIAPKFVTRLNVINSSVSSLMIVYLDYISTIKYYKGVLEKKEQRQLNTRETTNTLKIENLKGRGRASPPNEEMN